MSWSLQLRNGDLALSGTSLGQVTGGPKLVQDLRCAIMETRGNDDMHPLFGSTIDGGRDENGREVQGIVGTSDWEYAALVVQSEIQRIAGEYQRRQLVRAQEDRQRFGESTLSNSELLVSLLRVNYMQANDTLLVDVMLETGRGDQITVTVPVSGGWGYLQPNNELISW